MLHKLAKKIAPIKMTLNLGNTASLLPSFVHLFFFFIYTKSVKEHCSKIRLSVTCTPDLKKTSVNIHLLVSSSKKITFKKCKNNSKSSLLFAWYFDLRLKNTVKENDKAKTTMKYRIQHRIIKQEKPIIQNQWKHNQFGEVQTTVYTVLIKKLLYNSWR